MTHDSMRNGWHRVKATAQAINHFGERLFNLLACAAVIVIWIAIIGGVIMWIYNDVQVKDRAARREAHRVMCAELGEANFQGIARGEFSIKDGLESMRRNGC